MQELTVSRTIKPGQIMRIHPTEAFLGIDRGIIKITAIHDVPAVNAGCLEEANLYLEPLVNSAGSKEEVQSITEEVMDSPWVEYQYTSYLCRTPNASLNTPQYLPADIFLGSTTSY